MHCRRKEVPARGELVGQDLLEGVGVLRREANRSDVLVMLLVDEPVQERNLVKRAVRDVEEEIVEQVGAKKNAERA